MPSPTIRPTTRCSSAALRRWLFLAGYREPAAPGIFLMVTLAAMGFGLAILYLIHRSGLIADLIRNIARLPSGIGDIFLPVVYLAPWLVFIVLALFRGWSFAAHGGCASSRWSKTCPFRWNSFRP